MSETVGEGEEDFLGPGVEASRMRTAASMESSSKGFMLCFTFEVSMAVREALTRGLICGFVSLCWHAIAGSVEGGK